MIGQIKKLVEEATQPYQDRLDALDETLSEVVRLLTLIEGHLKSLRAPGGLR